jgi:hypothetical protein
VNILFALRCRSNIDDDDDNNNNNNNNNNSNNNRAMKCTYFRFCEVTYFVTKLIVLFIINVKFYT